MRIGEIIAQYRKEHNLSLRAFAERTGISRSYINTIENDVDNTRAITINKIGQLAKGMNMTSDELLDIMDEETPVNVSGFNHTAARSALPPGAFPIPDLSGLKKIPILGSSACGLPIEAIRSYDYIEVDSALKADFALFAEGKSMTGAGIMDGSMVFFRETEAVNNGEIAAVTVDNSTTIKRFYQYGETVILRACNPEFDDQEYSGDELMGIHVFGKAVACMTGLN